MAHSRRVAQLIESLAMGGAEHLAIQLAGHLAAVGCESHLIVLNGPGALSNRIDPRVHVHYLHYERASIANPIRFVISVVRGYVLVSKLVSAAKIALVQTHLPGANMWGLLLAMRRLCAVVATVHNNQEFRYTSSDSAIKVYLRKNVYRSILRRCNAVIAVSDSVKKSLQDELGVGAHLAAKIVVVPNGVPIPEPLMVGAAAPIRRRWGTPLGGHLLVGAGRLEEQKNFSDLIAAAAILKRAGTKFQLVIAGEGPLRSSLESAIARNGLGNEVHLPGVVGELPALFLAADLLVFPSLWEGLPLVLLEAMGAGLPVVGNDIDGVREIVEDGRSGRLVPAGDTEDLAAAILDALSDPERLHNWSCRAREIVATGFSFQRMGDQVFELYQQVLGDFHEPGATTP
ncbi:MAG: glycosyltransferase family 4 protein [bacterium]|nr:glycosyltransferase family 4 protein [bacterium]